jgi:sialate O-acetylesterase
MNGLTKTALKTVVLLFVASDATAELQVARVIGDHMVLQRGIPVPVWGTAEAG